MANIKVVFHSGYGHTLRQAQAVAEGAAAELITIDADGNIPEASWEQLASADLIVFGSPTYMGGPSWQFKKFADTSAKAWFSSAWRNKLFAGFTNSGSINGDKFNTLSYFFTLAMQHGGLWVGNGMKPASAKAADRNDVNWLGTFSGAAAQSPSDASPDEMFPGDLETARQFGQRIAEAAARWVSK